MGRCGLFLLALAVAAAACGTSAGLASDGGASTASTRTASTTTTTPDITTSTTTSSGASAGPEPDACQTFRGTSLPLDAGDSFCEEGFVVPVRVEVEADGWLVRQSSTTTILLYRDLDGNGAKDVSIALIAFNADEDPDLIRDAIVSVDGVDRVSEPETIALAGVDTLRFDVEGHEDGQADLVSPCTTYASPQIGFGAPGYGLVRGPTAQFEYGIAACFRSRVWVMDLGAISVTAVGVADPDDRFEELMPIVEDFLQSGVTFGATDG